MLAGIPGIDTTHVNHLLDRYVLSTIRGDADAFWHQVEPFVRDNTHEQWVRAWQANDGTFLKTLCWGADRRFGPEPKHLVKGAMDDRHLSNFVRLEEGGGIDRQQHIEGRRALVVGPWCGEEMLLLHALGAALVDGIEEVDRYAHFAQAQLDAWGVPGAVASGSLHSVQIAGIAQRYHLAYVPGVMYHLTDPICALVTLWASLKPGGLLAFETMLEEGEEMTATYLGAQTAGWNWWCPTETTWLRMMADCGFVGCRMADKVGGRAWFVGERSPRLPLVDTGAAGFSRPDLLDQLHKLALVEG